MKKVKNRGGGFDFSSLTWRLDRESFSQGGHRLLGRLDESNIRNLFSKSGLDAFFKSHCFDKYSIKLYRQEGIDFLEVYDKPDGFKLIDLRLSTKKFRGTSNDYYDMVVIEWLSTRDPQKQGFTSKRPQLPGQLWPGLGVLPCMLRTMTGFSKIANKDGFLDVPDHLHLSMMYAKKFRFFDPVAEGTFRAILRSLKKYSLDQIAWASVSSAIFEEGRSEPFIWSPGEQIFPVTIRLKRYFNSLGYRRNVNKQLKRKFYIDFSVLEKNKKYLIGKYDICEL